MKSKYRIEKQLKVKKNPNLVQTIIKTKKDEHWLDISRALSGPQKNRKIVNVGTLEKISKPESVIVVAGKVLSSGEITKKIKVFALNYSEEAKKKIENAGGKALTILEGIDQKIELKKAIILR